MIRIVWFVLSFNYSARLRFLLLIKLICLRFESTFFHLLICQSFSCFFHSILTSLYPLFVPFLEAGKSSFKQIMFIITSIWNDNSFFIVEFSLSLNGKFKEWTYLFPFEMVACRTSIRYFSSFSFSSSQTCSYALSIAALFPLFSFTKPPSTFWRLFPLICCTLKSLNQF